MNTVDWDQRYAGDDFFYGTTPNEFLVSQLAQLARGPVLFLAEGEGRNAVWLAEQGFSVTAVDQSAIGLAKAQRLAAARGQRLQTEVADLAHYAIEPGAWSGIVAIFMHLPPALRRRVLGQVATGLRPDGVFLFEGYTPAQVSRTTGGPKDPALCVQLADLRAGLAGLTEEHGVELERDVREGGGHSGMSNVVQYRARRR